MNEIQYNSILLYNGIKNIWYKQINIEILIIIHVNLLNLSNQSISLVNILRNTLNKCNNYIEIISYDPYIDKESNNRLYLSINQLNQSILSDIQLVTSNEIYKYLQINPSITNEMKESIADNIYKDCIINYIVNRLTINDSADSKTVRNIDSKIVSKIDSKIDSSIDTTIQDFYISLQPQTGDNLIDNELPFITTRPNYLSPYLSIHPSSKPYSPTTINTCINELDLTNGLIKDQLVKAEALENITEDELDYIAGPLQEKYEIDKKNEDLSYLNYLPKSKLEFKFNVNPRLLKETNSSSKKLLNNLGSNYPSNQQAHLPAIRVDVRVNQKKLDSKVDSKSDSKVNSKVGTEVDSKLNITLGHEISNKLDKQIADILNNQLDSLSLHGNTDSEIGSNIRSKLDVKIDVKLDSKRNNNLDSKRDSKIHSTAFLSSIPTIKSTRTKSESVLFTSTYPPQPQRKPKKKKIRRKNSCKLDSCELSRLFDNIDSKIDGQIDSKIGSKIDNKVVSQTDSKIDSKIDNKASSILVDIKVDNKRRSSFNQLSNQIKDKPMTLMRSRSLKNNEQSKLPII